MVDDGKAVLLGVGVSRIDYEGAIARVLDAARTDKPLALSALAVHGVMTGVGRSRAAQRWRLNHLDVVTPDGQPVRWAINLLYGAGLRERVYGPKLTEMLLERAAAEGLPVFFYGSQPSVLRDLVSRTRSRWPHLIVAGTEPSQFRQGRSADCDAIANRIRESGARIAFVGLGCPRQEVMVYELRSRLDLPVLAVGAAFDYQAGRLTEPPEWQQRLGLQWLYRLVQEPRRLWRRYLVLNPCFLTLVVLQWLHLWHPDTLGTEPPVDVLVDI